MVGGLFAGLPISIAGNLIFQLGVAFADTQIEKLLNWLEQQKIITSSVRRGEVVALLKVCGAVVAGHYLAYPFDTVCVRLQSGEFASIAGCIGMILEDEGILPPNM